MMEENSERASETANIMKDDSCKKFGIPRLSLPPGTVKAAANITVIMRAATIEQAVAVSFIYFSPSFTNSLCSSVKTSLGVCSLFTASRKNGWTRFSTACRKIHKSKDTILHSRLIYLHSSLIFKVGRERERENTLHLMLVSFCVPTMMEQDFGSHNTENIKLERAKHKFIYISWLKFQLRRLPRTRGFPTRNIVPPELQELRKFHFKKYEKIIMAFWTTVMIHL